MKSWLAVNSPCETNKRLLLPIKQWMDVLYRRFDAANMPNKTRNGVTQFARKPASHKLFPDTETSPKRKADVPPGERDLARLKTVRDQNRRLVNTLGVISKNQETTRRQIDTEIRMLREEFVQKQSELTVDDISKLGGRERRRSSQMSKCSNGSTNNRLVYPEDNESGSDGDALTPSSEGINVENINASIGLQVGRNSRRRSQSNPNIIPRRCSTADLTTAGRMSNLESTKSTELLSPDSTMLMKRRSSNLMDHISCKSNPGRKHSLAIVSRQHIKGVQLEENDRVQREATIDGRFTQLMVSLQPK